MLDIAFRCTFTFLVRWALLADRLLYWLRDDYCRDFHHRFCDLIFILMVKFDNKPIKIGIIAPLNPLTVTRQRLEGLRLG